MNDKQNGQQVADAVFSNEAPLPPPLSGDQKPPARRNKPGRN